MTAGMRGWLALAAFDGFLAVAAGAFGAHWARDARATELLRIGAQYQGVHAAAAFAIAGARPGRLATAAIAAFALGALAFGGSLDLLATGAPRLWGLVTPLGGLGLLAGWALAGAAVLRRARVEGPARPGRQKA